MNLFNNSTIDCILKNTQIPSNDIIGASPIKILYKEKSSYKIYLF